MSAGRQYGLSKRSRGSREYRLYGFNLSSDLPFTSRLAPSTGPADLFLELVDHAALHPVPPSLAPSYESRLRTENGESRLLVFRLDDRHVLRFPGIGEFQVEGRRVLLAASPISEPETVENTFLGVVMAFLLEREGILALHASAVEIHGNAVAFLSGNRGGKSTLAAALMGRDHLLVTDDILPVEVSCGVLVARPGYPTMRMWPEQVGSLLDRWEHLPRVHPAMEKRRVPVGPGGFGAFRGVSLPLSAVILPDRSEGPATPVVLEPVRAADAAIELIGNSFAAHVVQGLGWQERRLALIARIVTELPILRLHYPPGLECLGEVTREIERSLSAPRPRK